MKQLRPCVAEFIGTFTLILVGVGAIHNAGSGNGGLLMIALAHGLAIAVMVSATMHISGGQLNPAVTLGVLLGRKITLVEAIGIWIAQLAGAALAALICMVILGKDELINGTPQLSKAEGISPGVGMMIEFIMTFFLVFVVYGTGVDERGRKIGGLAIGLTVTMGILFGGPFTGAAINPARAFGPALIANFWTNQYVYWLGPMGGGAAAALVYNMLFLTPEKKP
jgi:MIP family channel proteins